MNQLDEPTAVDVVFDRDGHPRIRRFSRGETWLEVVAQGRTWLDAAGRHVMVMGPGNHSFELLLRLSDLSWRIFRAGPAELLV